MVFPKDYKARKSQPRLSDTIQYQEENVAGQGNTGVSDVSAVSAEELTAALPQGSCLCLFVFQELSFFILIFVFLSSLLDFFFLVCGAGFTLGTQNRLLRITRPNWPRRSYQLLVSNRYLELWRCTQVQFFKAAPKSWRMKRTNSKKMIKE